MSAGLQPSAAALAAAGYDALIVCTPDVTGRLVGRRVAGSEIDGALHHGVEVSSCIFGWDVAQNPGSVFSYTGDHTGWHDVELRPDLATLRPAPWVPRTAIVLADVHDRETGELVEVSARTMLRRQVDALAAVGLTASVATELEYHVYRTSYDDARATVWHGLVPSTQQRSSYGVAQADRSDPLFAEVRRVLDLAELDVLGTQLEWGLGQWETNLRHRDPLAMADAHVLLKLALRGVCAAQGWSVTFMARPYGATTGSSCHLHLSLRNADAAPAFVDAEVRRTAVGGVLAHAAEVMPFYGHTVNAYRRITSGEFSGNGLTWGGDSRMVSCRVLTGAPAATRLEWRVPGADADPYRAIAALLASVGDGVANGLDPGPSGGPDPDPASVRPLPAHLGAAAEAMLASPWARRTFGDDVIEHYGAAARWEWDQFLAPAAVTDWERARYFEES